MQDVLLALNERGTVRRHARSLIGLGGVEDNEHISGVGSGRYNERARNQRHLSEELFLFANNRRETGRRRRKAFILSSHSKSNISIRCSRPSLELSADHIFYI